MDTDQAESQAKKDIAAIYYREHAAVVDVSMRAVSADVHYRGRADSPPNFAMWREREERFRQAMSDITTTVLDQICEGDLVATHWVLEATHSGRLMDYEPSGKRIRMESICFDRVVNGEVVEHWGVRDLLSVLREIGVVPKFTPNR